MRGQSEAWACLLAVALLAGFPGVVGRTFAESPPVWPEPARAPEGVILSLGGSSGGYSLFIKDRKLHFVHNYVGAEELHVVSTVEVPEGEVEPGELAGQAKFPTTIPLMLRLGEGLTCGSDPGSPVSSLYQAPFECTGTLHGVTVGVSGALIEDEPAGREVQAKAAMAQQ